MSATGKAALESADAGATLLEMLVVVALMALTSGLVFANFRPALDRTVLEAARSELAQTLDRARARALRTGAPDAVELAEDGSAYASGGRTVVLPPGVRLEGDRTAVLFSPNGLTQGAHLALLRRGRRLGLEVSAGGGVVLMAGPG